MSEGPSLTEAPFYIPAVLPTDAPTSLEVVREGDQLSIIGQNISSVPRVPNAETVKQLHLSYNSIEKLQNLDQFPQLNSLIVDNNLLISEQTLPTITSLQTLWVNNNNISDLKVFLDCISKAFPNLTYLSMLKNPACPNYFTGKDTDDYKRYRYYVLYRMKKIKFLDSTTVTDFERKEAARRGPYLLTVKADLSQMKPPVAKQEEEDLPPSLPDVGAPEVKASARFGISNYVYVGKHSEGNRFITDDNL
eukprot:TRINITY_DN17121_c0_g1_i1.p1 TRINITY_DN17121_c0_g1~~TRINITY_DN17121_c0_g1_i1.p1  ORF type:complete len:249 (-),score=55.61 TRINITY_DN17121_c0_g1_i1:31-777(-)